jgi:hypothetical protein
MNNEFSYKFDRLQWLASKGFLSRATIFLDLRFWIDMVEHRDANHIKLKELLTRMVEEQRVICPVSPTLLLELKKQPDSEKRTKCCQLMDELSKGLSIRNWLVIFKDEFKARIEGRQIEQGFGYSHFIEAFSAGMEFIFDKSWTDDQARNYIFAYLDNALISDVVGIEIDEDKVGSMTFFRDGLSKIAEQKKIWGRDHPGEWNIVEQAEFGATLQVILPQIFNVATEVPFSILEFQTTTSAKEKTDILNRCSTFWCHHQLTTALRSNRSSLNENDLWDSEHATSALPYVKCFACDAGTRHVCSDVLKLDEKYGTKVISKVNDLIVWLETI